MNNQSTQPSESILQKIRALFKMADPTNGASQNEMEVAMQKAKELMVRHGIEQMEMGDVSQKESGILHERFNTGRKKRDEDRWIPAVLKQVFEVDILFSKVWDPSAGVAGGYRHIYVFVGTPADVEIAKTVLPVIYAAMSRGLNAHLKARGITWNTSTANSFFRGVADGFIKASVHGQAAAMKAFKKDELDRFAIVLANKKDAIAKYQKESMDVKKGRQSSSSARHDASAFADGFARGKSIDVTTKLQAA